MYRFAEHTGEVELHIRAETPEDVFADALAAFAELVRPDGEEGGEELRCEIELEASDPATLLADWLSELVFLAETEGLVPERTDALELADTRLKATVQGRRGDPLPLVKAVTYHGLELRREDDGWYACVVLDV